MHWTTIDGKSWKYRDGERVALVWLHTDEKTYHTNVYPGDGAVLFPDQEGGFSCIKKAKAACLEAIADYNVAEEMGPAIEEDEVAWRTPGPGLQSLAEIKEAN